MGEGRVPARFVPLVTLTQSMVAQWIKDGMPHDWGMLQKELVESTLDLSDIYRYKSRVYRISYKEQWRKGLE